MYQPLGATADPTTMTLPPFTQWQKFKTGAGSNDPVVVTNAGVAPDGSATATRVQFVRGPGVPNANSSSSYSILRFTGPQPNGPFTNSVYAALAPGASAAKIGLRAVGDVNGTSEGRKVFPLTPDWQRLAVSAVCAGGGIWFDVLLWDGMPDTSLAADVLLWNPRSDAGAAPIGPDYTATGIDPKWLFAGGLVALYVLSGNHR